MIIIHTVNELLAELFPKYKDSGNNLDVLKQELIDFYTFSVYKPKVEISDGFVKITIDTQRIENELQKYQDVIKLCEMGNFMKAKPQLEGLINKNPTNSEYHRILGQIYSGEGDQELAIDTLIDALRWDSRNTFALTMMGNIIAKYREDIPTAMKYYNQVIEINPNDNIAVNNIGANLMQQGKIEEAKGYFHTALGINPDYPHTHYALALVAKMQDDLPSAFSSAIQAMKNSKSKDGLYRQAIAFATETAKNIIDSGIGNKIVSEYQHKLELDGGTEINIVEDEKIATAAKIEFAENYNRSKHIIKFKPNYPAVEHLIMHEMVHLDLVIEARKAGLNQLFISTDQHKAAFIKLLNPAVKNFRQRGISEDSINSYCSSFFQGMNSQVYNTPIDLFIENFLFNEYPELRPFQFLSLYSLIKEGINAVTDKKVVELTPKEIISKSKVYNMVNAIQFAELYGYDFLREFNATPAELKQAQSFYDEYLQYRDNREPAEEYELVIHWAEDLKLNMFFELEGETQYRRRNNIDTFIKALEDDPLGLDDNDPVKDREMKRFKQSQERHGINMAVMMFMVDALGYFEGMPTAKVKQIALEIAMQGAQGYSPDKQGYLVNLIPDKSFSGNHILAYYYVSFALAMPEMLAELQLPFDAEYEQAKIIHKG